MRRGRSAPDRCQRGGLVGPRDEHSDLACTRIRSNVNVSRRVWSCGTSFATTQRPVTSSAAVRGNRDPRCAVCAHAKEARGRAPVDPRAASTPAMLARTRSSDRAAASRSRRFALETMRRAPLTPERCQEGRERHAVVRVGRLSGTLRSSLQKNSTCVQFSAALSGALPGERAWRAASIRPTTRSGNGRAPRARPARPRRPHGPQCRRARSHPRQSKRHGVQLYTSRVSVIGRRPQPGRTTVALPSECFFDRLPQLGRVGRDLAREERHDLAVFSNDVLAEVPLRQVAGLAEERVHG